MQKVEPQSDVALTNVTTYLALTGEIWCVFRELISKIDWYIKSAQCLVKMSQ